MVLERDPMTGTDEVAAEKRATRTALHQTGRAVHPCHRTPWAAARQRRAVDHHRIWTARSVFSTLPFFKGCYDTWYYL